MKTQGTRLVLLALAAAATLHCSGRRERRPVVVAAPTPLPASAPSATPPPGGLPSTQPAGPLANGQQPQPGVAPTGPQPAPGTTPTGPAILPPMTITTTTDDGQTINLEWDGKAYKGNDKWDVAPQ